MRESKALNIDRDIISYSDLIMADKEMIENEDLISTELLTAFLNIALPTASSILAGMFHIIQKKNVL